MDIDEALVIAVQVWCDANTSDIEMEPRLAKAFANKIVEVTITPRHKILLTLELFRSFGCPHCSGDCGSENPPRIVCPMRLMDEAIEEARKLYA